MIRRDDRLTLLARSMEDTDWMALPGMMLKLILEESAEQTKVINELTDRIDRLEKRRWKEK